MRSVSRIIFFPDCDTRNISSTKGRCMSNLSDVASTGFGFMKSNPVDATSDKFDMHRPFVDEIFLVSQSGKKMMRETDLIDVWFDSGAMPYAQWHYPFENKEEFAKSY